MWLPDLPLRRVSQTDVFTSNHGAIRWFTFRPTPRSFRPLRGWLFPLFLTIAVYHAREKVEDMPVLTPLTPNKSFFTALTTATPNGTRTDGLRFVLDFLVAAIYVALHA